MAADAIAEYGMALATLSEATLSKLRKNLPAYCSVSETTVDLTGSASSKDYDLAFRILAEDPNVHILMSFFVFQDTPLDEGIVEVICRLKERRKPIVCCAAGGPYTKKMSEILESNLIPVYETAERAVAVISALVYQATVSGESLNTFTQSYRCHGFSN